METIGKQEVWSFYNDSEKSESVRDISIASWTRPQSDLISGSGNEGG